MRSREHLPELSGANKKALFLAVGSAFVGGLQNTGVRSGGRGSGGEGRQALQGSGETEAVLGMGTEDTTRWASFRAGQATWRLETSYEAGWLGSWIGSPFGRNSLSPGVSWAG